MKSISCSLITLLLLVSCSKEKSESPQLSENLIRGELSTIAKERGLTAEDLLASVKTYLPSGASQEYIAFYGTGVAGRLAVVGLPSMKILKYVSVFSAEPWQGYAFDDESKSIIKNSSRDEIEYSFGDSGRPALSLTKGQHDARVVFMSDAANGRIGLVDLSEYETKQIVTNPLFKNSNPDVSVSENTDYVAQTTAYPEMIDGKKLSGATLWKFVEKKNADHKMFFIDPVNSFTVLQQSEGLSSPTMGKGSSEGLLFYLSKGDRVLLNILDWKAAEKILANNGTKTKNHFSINAEVALSKKILTQIPITEGSDQIIVSGSGEQAVITNRKLHTISLVDLTSAKKSNPEIKLIDVGSNSVDAAFAKENIYVTLLATQQLVRISTSGKILSKLELNYIPGKIMIPGSDTSSPSEGYAVLTNHSATGRFTNVGPQTAISVQLVDIKAENMMSLYDASIPQATRLAAVALSATLNKPVYKYKIGTDPRTGLISNYKTPSGQEKVIRHGKRVHVYATLIRSHITPDFIEVEQGDIVSIHLTSNEQSKDQVHGFTIDTYNVHGSWEPGKSATVTFTADRPGVFPFYCTEFCSALHLEMQGYLLVKPSNTKLAQNDDLMKLHNNTHMKSFFNYIKGE